ncbi:MAG: hypothetical protein M1838_001586 [Thelocarpon superellum]|nr:MAG: hypothetical protein M1838_001586 [Thelocarpon superellum]
MDHRALSRIDPELDELFQRRPPATDSTKDILAQRQAAGDRKRALVAAAASIPPESLAIHERHIPTRDGTEIALRVYTPKTAAVADGRPGCFVMLHGGGFCFGDLDSEQINCTNICKQIGLVVVNVAYRLAPEHRFPTAHNDGYDAVKWVAAHASTIGTDLSKAFILGGTSAGANIAAAILHQARDVGLSPPLTGAWLSVPTVVSAFTVPEQYRSQFHSYEQNKDAPILSRADLVMIYDAYRPEPESPIFSPLNYPTGHNGLPPTYFQICGMDPLRDEAFIFDHVLRECGTKTKVDVYPGLPHGFWSAYPSLSASKKRTTDSVEGARWLYDQGGRGSS